MAQAVAKPEHTTKREHCRRPLLATTLQKNRLLDCQNLAELASGQRKGFANLKPA